MSTPRMSEQAMAAAKGKGKMKRDGLQCRADVAPGEPCRKNALDGGAYCAQHADQGDTAIGTVRGAPSPEELADRDDARDDARRTIAGAARPLPKVHRVKSWPESFRAVVTGRKRFEMRRDDRNYQPGDTIELREYTPNLQQLDLVPGGGQPGTFSGRSWIGIVGYVSRGGPLPAGWCAFDLISVEDVNRLEGVRK